MNFHFSVRCGRPSFRPALAVWVGLLSFGFGLAQAQTFPNTPLQTAANRPAANLMFILDDSGSMEFDYMPDDLTNSTFVRRNAWFNPLAYDPKRDYRPWRKADGTLMTGGTDYTSAFSEASRLVTATNLWTTTQVFYYPISMALARGNTDRRNYYEFTIYASGSNQYYRRCETRTSGSSAEWDRNCVYGETATVGGRTLANELKNYATWFSYHRTRMKVAKAGVTESFSQLQDNIRVGYDSIWNRSAFVVPVSSDQGLFRGANKSTWFDRVVAADGSGGTPLHGALARAGAYFERSDAGGPWGPEAPAAQFSCRQNFAILTTDGYWNNDTGYTAAAVQAGNSDNTAGALVVSSKGENYTYAPRRPYSDTGVDTLADIAMRYWKSDLRTDLANNVPASVDNPAFWQHMVTFGISIGLNGTLDPKTDLPSLTNGSKTWPDPWRLTATGSRSWSNESPRRIDDLWHASVNGRGQFSVANEPDEFARGMKSALASIQKMLASGSNVSTSSTSLQTDTRIFHATYYSGLWTGELAAFDISAAGISQEPAWLASQGIAYATRKVFTATAAGAGASFPTATQETALATGLSTLGMTATGAEIARYLKGDRSLEIAFGGRFRNRETVLGDIVNSSPIYAIDSDTIYVGSNGGMVHGFNASTGTELFSYVPKGVDVQKLGTLASPDYAHRFFVDGQLVVTRKAQTPAKNYLVGALGRGGKGVYALDVTAPTAFANASVLWDATGSVDTDMGYVTGDLLTAKMGTGDSVVIVPNGIDSTSGTAALFVYRISDGVLLKKINTGITGSNGLSSPRGWDEDGDGDVDYVYAGDLKGNLWRFDFNGAGVADWKLGFGGQPLFQARDGSGNPQPITGGLSLAREAFGDRRWILFGTGRYIAQEDIVSQSLQSLYGVIDSGASVGGRAALQKRDIQLVQAPAGGNALRAFETHTPLPAGKKGWFVDLDRPYAGERVIERGFISGRVFVVPSVVPVSGNACESSGKGFMNAIDAFTGTTIVSQGVNHPYFDVGQDGSRTNDYLGSGSARLPVGSIETSIGMVTKPVLVGDQLVYGGSSGGKENQRVNLPPASPKRLNWRELIRD